MQLRMEIAGVKSLRRLAAAEVPRTRDSLALGRGRAPALLEDRTRRARCGYR